MGIIPGILVPPPEPLRRRYGLLTAASGPLDLPSPHGRGGGVRYAPVTCGSASPYPIGCYGGLVDQPAEDKAGTPGDVEVDARPFMVVAAMECGAVGYTGPEFEERVQRRLLAGEQGAAELALWTGTDPGGNALNIQSLTSTEENLAAASYDSASLPSVVAALEEYAYNTQGYGYVAFIHAPVSVASWAASHGDLAVRDGPLLRTPFGSIWVFGGGYPSDGGIHITGQVTVWRSPDVFVFPADQTMNRVTNQRLLVAEREYAIAYDCLNGRAEFNPLEAS